MECRHNYVFLVHYRYIWHLHSQVVGWYMYDDESCLGPFLHMDISPILTTQSNHQQLTSNITNVSLIVQKT